MTIPFGGDPRPDLWGATRVLDMSVAREGWFGPARNAYDVAVSALCYRLTLLDARFAGR